MHPCKSGRHTWFNADDAQCCDPAWRRILVVCEVRDATHGIAESSTLMGRRWVRVGDQADSKTRGHERHGPAVVFPRIPLVGRDAPCRLLPVRLVCAFGPLQPTSIVAFTGCSLVAPPGSSPSDDVV